MASRTLTLRQLPRLFHSTIRHARPLLPRPPPPALRLLRATHSIPRPPDANQDLPVQARIQMTFTCRPCEYRSTHIVSKQGYYKGSVLISCPNCRNRHVISDHLNIFGDRSFTVEELLRERGQLVKRGTLGEDGDIEFWSEDSESTSGH